MANENYTIIIVDDIAETRDNLSKLSQFESDIEVLGVARTGREGIKLAKDVEPDVVLMDINMPDIDGIKATEIIQEKNPATQIVILSVQGDANYMRRAMLAGARDFLTKPPKADELVSAIHRAGKKPTKKKKKFLYQPLSRRNLRNLDKWEGVRNLVLVGRSLLFIAPKEA
ncbi:MAG: Transcriptional regulatory protein DegU [Chloroflexi bacterium]|nr:Transcriptional regulatory protein DegU [Chloroflexota bacterium]